MVTMRPAELTDHGEFSAESSGSMEGCGVLPDSVAAEGAVPRGRSHTDAISNFKNDIALRNLYRFAFVVANIPVTFRK